jgi:hypothetical protein
MVELRTAKRCWRSKTKLLTNFALNNRNKNIALKSRNKKFRSKIASKSRAQKIAIQKFAQKSHPQIARKTEIKI